MANFIIIGGGGHALSVAETANALGWAVAGCVAPETAPLTRQHLRWLGQTPDPARQADSRLINGIGSAGPTARRRSVYEGLRDQGWQFSTLIHPSANVGDVGLSIGRDVQILAGACINAGSRIGDNVLINTRAVLEHGCTVGDHSHIASGAVICGDCVIGAGVHIGAGATVIQGVEVGFGSVIAAGAAVIHNVEPLTLVGGVPARKIREIDEQELA